MSLRFASRLARPALSRAVARGTAVPRRYASTHKSSSDMPWAAGSLVVFGGLAAFISMGGKKADDLAHDVHNSIDAKASGENTKLPTSHDNPAIEHADPDGKHKQGEDEGASVSSVKGGSSQSGDDSKSEKKGEKEGGKDEGKDDGDEDEGKDDDKKEGGDEPSDEEVKSSIKQAAKSNAPKAAMSEESKGGDASKK